jgi:hypothetical protein
MGSATSILVSNNFITALSFDAGILRLTFVTYVFLSNEGKGNLFMVSYDDRRPSPTPLLFRVHIWPWSCQQFFFCVYLRYTDVELLCAVIRADCMKLFGVEHSQV